MCSENNGVLMVLLFQITPVSVKWLLKNKNNLLPLKKQGTIALIGPLGDEKENMPGTWSVAANFSKAISLRKGLEDATGGKAKILYAKGSNLYEDANLETFATPFGKGLHRDNRSADELRNE